MFVDKPFKIGDSIVLDEEEKGGRVRMPVSVALGIEIPLPQRDIHIRQG